MGMGNSFETITVLQYRLKAAQEELAAFQSGEKYIRMEKQHLTQVRALERRIAKLEAAVAKEHSHAITIRNQWFEIFEQLQKECDRMVAEAVRLYQCPCKRGKFVCICMCGSGWRCALFCQGQKGTRWNKGHGR